MKAFIIDDEPHNVQNLKFLLAHYCPSVEVVGTAFNADEGIDYLSENQIDVLFLDIQMPGKNGFDLLLALKTYNFSVIFVTAYENYAIKAIKFSALDYLLKPINRDELIQAVKRAESDTSKRNTKEQVKHLLASDHNQEKSTIALALENELRMVKLADIIYCQSDNNYTWFYLADGEKILVSKGLYEFETLLPESSFVRCHMSYIVNLAFVKSLIREGTSSFLKTALDQDIPVSRAKKNYVKTKLTEK